MEIYNQKEDLWIQAWEYIYEMNRYVDDYSKRIDEAYYNKDVLDMRKDWSLSHSDLSTSFDFGCGWRPWHYNFDDMSSDIGGMYDKFTPNFTYFDKEAYNSAKTMYMYDVIEHMYDPHTFLLTLPMDRVLISVPCVPYDCFNCLSQIKQWRHYRPGEHLMYANERGWTDIFNTAGFEVESSGYWESPIREDIMCFVLNR